MSPLPSAMLACLQALTDHLCLAVARNKGQEAATNCFAGVNATALAAIIHHHFPATDPAHASAPSPIPSGLDLTGPASSTIPTPTPIPKQAAHGTAALIPQIKNLLTCGRQSPASLGALLRVAESDIELAIASEGSGLTIKGTRVTLAKP